MLWHGSRHPPSRGSGTNPCRLALYPRECQPLNRVPRPPDLGVREAGPVPGTPDDVDRLRWLRTADGAAAVARAATLLAEGVDLLPGVARLRDEVGPGHAGPAWELARLRARARPVFGDDADVLLLTADALEQAGRPELAGRRAARLLDGGAASVADLGCAAGTDTVALARTGASVVAVDRDPVARELTAANSEALGLAARVRVLAADVVDLVAAATDGRVAGCAAATLDPARRA